MNSKTIKIMATVPMTGQELVTRLAEEIPSRLTVGQERELLTPEMERELQETRVRAIVLLVPEPAHQVILVRAARLAVQAATRLRPATVRPQRAVIRARRTDPVVLPHPEETARVLRRAVTAVPQPGAIPPTAVPEEIRRVQDRLAEALEGIPPVQPPVIRAARPEMVRVRHRSGTVL